MSFTRNSIGLVLCGLVSSVSADPKISIHSDFYRISGHDLPGIYQSLQHSGPQGDHSKPYHAHTQWNIEWGYRWIQSARQCRLSQVNVSIRIDMLMPQLQNLESLEPGLQQSWQRFYQALEKHENHHKDIGIRAAQDLESTLLAVPPRECIGLENALAEKAQRVLEKYDAMEKAYDRETNHGVNEGVVLQ